MLSRVAERLYWLSRYLERAEDAARLINAYSHLVLDIPKGAEPGWHILFDTMDAAPLFELRYKNVNERNVVKFLLADKDNDGSIRTSVRWARENMRTTRDVLPAQVWELVNETNLYVEAHAGLAIARQPRFEFLEEVIARCQQIVGLIETTVLQDHGLWFMRLGRLLERADMTSRIIDVGAAAILERTKAPVTEIPLLWGNLLKSLSATSAYRRSVGPTLTANQVIGFLFHSTLFPRSIVFCLSEVNELIGRLKGPRNLQQDLRGMQVMLGEFDASKASPADLHQFIDLLQVHLGDLDAAINTHWFARNAH
jgi:uncharacterized alpha-E superfamily protein